MFGGISQEISLMMIYIKKPYQASSDKISHDPIEVLNHGCIKEGVLSLHSYEIEQVRNLALSMLSG